MGIFELDGHRPKMPEDGSVWIAPGAHVIGQVRLASEASAWFNAVLRGDNEPIEIGAGSHIQVGTVCHTDPGFPLTVGAGVTVGHMALLHGCTIGDRCLIGMGAAILNGAVIGEGCLIGANALITEGKEIPPGSLVMGQPSRVIRSVDDSAAERIRLSAEAYVMRSAQYSKGLHPAQD